MTEWITMFIRWAWQTALQIVANIDQAFVTLAHRLEMGLTWVALQVGVPEWVVLIVMLFLPPVAVVAIFPGFFAFITWLERKALGRIQNRIGPNRVGPYGLLQPMADGLKMLTKEDIIPERADKFLHTLAPVMIVVPAITLFAVLPYGRNMIPADLNVAVLFFFAISSIATIALFLAGWGSHNKYSMIGAMRAIAQMISYELPVVMTAVPAIMMAGSLRVSDIVAAQGPTFNEAFPGGTIVHWFVWKPWGFVGFIAFFVAAMVELNRSPFDIAEGESEIVAGFHTEYSGFKFALFFLAEYMSAIAASGLATTLFLGGWWGPSFLPSWVWFTLKWFSLMCVMIWLRGTLPRMRVDQLMGFAWKFMLPLAFVNIVVTGVWYFMPREFWFEKALAWGLCAVILGFTYLALVQINAGPALQKRIYRYANL